MIGEKMQAALNEQINEELFSEYIYLGMTTYFHAQGLDGMAKWFKAQAREERNHAMKLFEHIVERGGRVELKALKEPPQKWDSALSAWKAALEHEVYITGKINALVDLAAEVKDRAAWAILQWFITEQVEEEDNATKVIQMLERIGPSGSGLVMLDRELGKRE